MTQTPPFFTIITATYNAASTLPRLLDSLVEQTFQNFQFIIQDGASTDKTLEIIEKYQSEIPHISVQSEKDTGIYDAWNKALPRIQGEWVLFLGADDALPCQETLQNVYDKVKNISEDILFACGTVNIVTKDNSIIEVFEPHPEEAKNRLQHGEMPTGHTGLLHHHSCFKKTQFNTKFKIAGDYDLLCRLWPAPDKIIDLHMVTANMYIGGISDNPFTTFTVRQEIFSVLWRLYPKNISFRKHILPLCKGALLHAICLCFGKEHAPKILDKIRTLRGLPPIWQKKERE